MSKIEECWVIQRDDGKFYVNARLGKNIIFTDKISLAHIDTFENIKSRIELFRLKDCKAVKVELRVVGE